MEEVKLAVQVRTEIGIKQVKVLRRQDFVPGIVYGGDAAPTAIKVDRRTYERIRRQHRGESIVFHLDVLQGDQKLRDDAAIVKEEQHDPVTDRIMHVDFKRISLKQEIEVSVPLAVKGEAIGVKRDKGSLEHLLWDLDIICLPTDIPQHIDVDVSGLEIDGVIHVKDIVLPAGVRTEHDPEAIVFAVHAARRMEEEPAEPEAGVEPEVIKDKAEKPAEG